MCVWRGVGGGGVGGGRERVKTAKIMRICLLVWLPWQQKTPIAL